MQLFTSASLFCLVWLTGTGMANAQSNWLTLVGDPSNPSSDYIQFDPMGLSRMAERPTIPVRVSRSHVRTSTQGTAFRSFVSVVAVDCKTRTPYYLQATFYAQPSFQGEPITTEVYSSQTLRPAEFKLIQGTPKLRVVNAACKKDTIKTL